MIDVRAGAMLKGSGDKAAGRSACDRAASAKAPCAIIAALARFIDRVSINWAWSAPKGGATSSVSGGLVSAGAGLGPRLAAEAAASDASAFAAFAALGAGLAFEGRGLAEVGRPAFRGLLAAGSARGAPGLGGLFSGARAIGFLHLFVRVTPVRTRALPQRTMMA